MLTDKIIKEEQRSPQAKINGYIENRLGKLTTRNGAGKQVKIGRWRDIVKASKILNGL